MKVIETSINSDNGGVRRLMKLLMGISNSQDHPPMRREVGLR